MVFDAFAGKTPVGSCNVLGFTDCGIALSPLIPVTAIILEVILNVSLYVWSKTSVAVTVSLNSPSKSVQTVEPLLIYAPVVPWSVILYSSFTAVTPGVATVAVNSFGSPAFIVVEEILRSSILVYFSSFVAGDVWLPT